ncbi:Mechanosensitive ion channel-domain-containing protein [Baffinella frigidus]|nr:Mechanosensitive ion channel-domain-containing protein [Cryptophyta sp. CCMP2293]
MPPVEHVQSADLQTAAFFAAMYAASSFGETAVLAAASDMRESDPARREVLLALEERLEAGVGGAAEEEEEGGAGGTGQASRGDRNMDDPLMNAAAAWPSPGDRGEELAEGGRLKYVWLERVGATLLGAALAASLLLVVQTACRGGGGRCSTPRVARFWARTGFTWQLLRRVLPIACVVVGYGASVWLSRHARERVDGALKIDPTTSVFLQGVIKWMLLAVGGSLILKLFGVHLAGMDGLLASFGIALGLASQRVLQNIAAGITLMLFRPFKIGDKVVVMYGAVPVEGYVKQVSLFETRILTPDKRVENDLDSGWRIFSIYAECATEVQTAGGTNITDARRVLEEAIAPYAYLAIEDSVPEHPLVKKEHEAPKPREGLRKQLSGFLMPGAEGKKRQDLTEVVLAMTSFYLMQKKKKEIETPNPPGVPSLEFDKWKVCLVEVIAKALQVVSLESH